MLKCIADLFVLVGVVAFFVVLFVFGYIEQRSCEHLNAFGKPQRDRTRFGHILQLTSGLVETLQRFLDVAWLVKVVGLCFLPASSFLADVAPEETIKD
jgi:hypothetical protein